MALDTVLAGLDLARAEDLHIAALAKVLVQVLDEALVARRAVLLPLSEQIERQGAQQGTELAIMALLVRVDDDVSFEDPAEVHPELVWTGEALVEQ